MLFEGTDVELTTTHLFLVTASDVCKYGGHTSILVYGRQGHKKSRLLNLALSIGTSESAPASQASFISLWSRTLRQTMKSWVTRIIAGYASVAIVDKEGELIPYIDGLIRMVSVSTPVLLRYRRANRSPLTVPLQK